MRHARPAAGWGEDPDPGLDATGRDQADAAARILAERLESAPIFTSPLRRCRETAVPLEKLWGRPAQVLPALGEVPAPGATPQERQRWLKQTMLGKWSQVEGAFDHVSWRRAILAALNDMKGEAVIYTHFIAINVAVAGARGADDVVCFRPDHASITTVECAGGTLKVVELGRQADTTILARG